ncbi:metallophosphoesterase [Paraburkholderia sp. UCT31]|uniref:metallophosphoesterase n=1 Tax=Paraburkholderia sp. UCT31 TaxID=2615209 RepID=UPI0016560BDC|nr:metallophosphoesterase [Paraburkholderia sp. UCT31]MBC8737333.1 metallophosphoesterase [Paraburkholderia sp. UCT31]
MRVHILSDLHMDDAPWLPPEVDADVTIAAGDLFDDGERAIQWCADHAQRTGRPVLYVPGNHELAPGSVANRLKAILGAAKRSNVLVLHNRSVVLQGIRFVGTPCWTDFELDGRRMAQISKHAAGTMLADFGPSEGERTDEGAPRITPEYAVRMHARAKRALLRGLEDAYSEPVVIITHHAPSARSLSTRYNGSALNPSFASNLDELVAYSNARLWVHGHAHESADYVLGTTRVVCNPRGTARHPNTAFAPQMVVVVE